MVHEYPEAGNHDWRAESEGESMLAQTTAIGGLSGVPPKGVIN
jgi:hypothetical protein